MFDTLESIFGIKAQSAYIEEAEGPKITLSSRGSLNERIVEACKNPDDYAREYVPVVYTEKELASFEQRKKEQEEYRQLFDLGLVRPVPLGKPPFRIKE